jgi:CubicO group peptidase (beta-lactamase class C family)
MQIDVQGSFASGYADVVAAFADNFARYGEGGASLAIFRHGELVVDVWGGIEPITGRAWEADSVTTVFSVTKTAATATLLRLVERGLVELDAPVSRYWPEFSQGGKESLTIRDVLAHLVALPELRIDDPEALLDADAMSDRLAREAPQYEPRRSWVYHPLSFGYLVGEIVLRVTGETIGTVFRREIAEPLGLDYWIGLPESAEPRYRLAHYDAPPTIGPVSLPRLATFRPALQCMLRSMDELHALVMPPPGAPAGTELMNQRRFRAAEVAAVNGVTNARSLARFFASLIGPVDGVRLISENLLREATRSQTRGTTPIEGPPGLGQSRQKQFGLGFDLPGTVTPMLNAGSFGHSGIGGRVGFAHPATGLALGYVSTKMIWTESGADPRWVPIAEALRRVAQLPDES